MNTQFSSIWPIDWTLSYATAQQEWTWERWQWRGTLSSAKLQPFWNHTIKLSSVISRTLICGVFPLCRVKVNVFYIHRRLGNPMVYSQLSTSIYTVPRSPRNCIMGKLQMINKSCEWNAIAETNDKNAVKTRKNTEESKRRNEMKEQIQDNSSREDKQVN